MKLLMIYSATGYTGRMIAARAAAADTPVVLAGRNEAKLAALAAAEAGRRVLAGESSPGFQTPTQLFGNGFAETIAITRIPALEPGEIR